MKTLILTGSPRKRGHTAELAEYLAARLSGERLALYDRTHREAFFSVLGQWKIIPVEEFSMGPAGVEEREFRALWRQYYKSVSIEGRYNPKCQSTHLPKRYRHVMTEFLTDGEMESGGRPGLDPAPGEPTVLEG